MIAYINIVINMNEEENEKLKIAFMSYFNHFIDNTIKIIDNSNADKPTKDSYRRLLSYMIDDVEEFLIFETKAVNNE